MTTDVDADLVATARDGDKAALEKLVVAYLPLVYNIVRRALKHELDVEDTVQDTMLQVVRALPELRDPAAFRSWLVAITMNQIRRHHRREQPGPQPPEAFDGLADPASDFAELTVWELELAGQRKQTVAATAWLDDDDRELLSLWWLVKAGQLSRAEMVTALATDAHTVTVRVGRVKTQLETARAIISALAAAPRCPELATAIAAWPGRPTPLWRKRIARHIRGCDYCSSTAEDLIPAEHLLAHLALVPVPFGLAALVSNRLRSDCTGPRNTRRRASQRSGQRMSGRGSTWAGKLVGIVGAATAFGGAVAMAATGSSHTTVLSTANPATPQPDTPAATSSTPASASRSSVPAHSTPRPALPSATPPGGSPVPTTNPAPHSSRSPTAADTGTAPSQSPSTAASSSDNNPSSAAAGDRVLTVINKARADNGVAPLARVDVLDRSTAAHTRFMIAGCHLKHRCPGEADLGARIAAAGAIGWGFVGENIGEGRPVGDDTGSITGMALELTRLMLAENPPDDGHRANILNPGFHHIGISVLIDGSGVVWMTQDFAN